MDLNLFREHEYEYDLFELDSLLVPPQGYKPTGSFELGPVKSASTHILTSDPPASADWRNRSSVEHTAEADEYESSQGEGYYFATDYELDLASRAYDNLFADKPFSLNGLKPEVLESVLADWKKEIGHSTHLDKLVMERYRDEPNDPDLPRSDEDEFWLNSLEISVEDRAWDKLFSERPFDLHELRRAARDHEVALWRKEIIELNKEDHQRHQQSHEDSTEREIEEEYFDPSAVEKNGYLAPRESITIEKLEKLYNTAATRDFGPEPLNKFETNHDRNNQFTRDDWHALDMEMEQLFKLEQQFKRSPSAEMNSHPDDKTVDSDFNKVLFGDQPSICLSGEERDDTKMRLDLWEKNAFDSELIREQNDPPNRQTNRCQDNEHHNQQISLHTNNEYAGSPISPLANGEHDSAPQVPQEFQSLDQIMQQVQKDIQMQIDQTFGESHQHPGNHEDIGQSTQDKQQQYDRDREDDSSAGADERSR
jgi:hypothetical protein